MSYSEISMFPPSRQEGPIELRLRDATQDQLASGIAAASETFDALGVSPVHACICHAAVLAHEFDPSLPRPDAGVLSAAVAFEQATEAAILAAGGVGSDGGELSVDQGSDSDAETLWSAIPTLRVYRAKYCPGTAELPSER